MRAEWLRRALPALRAGWKKLRTWRVLWAVNPFQGLAESLAVGLLTLAAGARLEGYVEPFVFQAAALFLCGACGMWAVLRIRIPSMLKWSWQLVYELVTALGLSLVMGLALPRLGTALHWDAILRLAGWGNLTNQLLLYCTGIGYLGARIGARLWLRWDQMRRKRMLWSLTHAHLTVVLFFAFLAALVAFGLAPYSATALKIWAQTRDPLASVITGLLVTFFPALVLITIATAAALAVMLPPLAIFSFFVARRTTRRLEALARTTAALRAGDARARVAVDGEDEVARLQADFNAMAERLEGSLAELKAERDRVAQVLQARRDLVANVSHELRTPVATLRAAVETALADWEAAPPADNLQGLEGEPTSLEADPKGPKVRQKLEIMEKEIQRLSGLIDDLFTLSQAEVKALALACGPVELAPLVAQVVGACAPLAWQAGRVEVSAALPPGLPAVLADERRLQQVLLNLLRNAVRHTPPGGIVVVAAAVEGEEVRIEVRDTGEGIAPEDLPRIWERFYRGKNHAEESAGLGLALVKELVEAMGGSVGVESEVGRGSCFWVRMAEYIVST